MEIFFDQRYPIKTLCSKELTRRKLFLLGTSSILSGGFILNAASDGIMEEQGEIIVRNGWILLKGDLK